MSKQGTDMLDQPRREQMLNVPAVVIALLACSGFLRSSCWC
jgi:hypothetical protein